MRNPIKKILASKIAWQLTGLTYTTAVIATHGKYISKKIYTSIGKDEIKNFLPYLSGNKTVLEFGCGLGKNLFCISNAITTGYGIDINPLYISLAKKLAKKYNFNNLYFLQYNGIEFPDIPKIDVIFEKGVFERLNKTMVATYIKRLSEYLNKKGIIILYFLMERVRGTEFTKKLGDSAYVFWKHDEIESLLGNNGIDQ